MKPTVGRVVHYGTESGPLAAIITGVDEESGFVALCVFNETGLDFVDAEYREKLEEGKWSWPKREE